MLCRRHAWWDSCDEVHTSATSLTASASVALVTTHALASRLRCALAHALSCLPSYRILLHRGRSVGQEWMGPRAPTAVGAWFPRLAFFAVKRATYTAGSHDGAHE